MNAYYEAGQIDAATKFAGVREEEEFIALLRQLHAHNVQAKAGLIDDSASFPITDRLKELSGMIDPARQRELRQAQRSPRRAPTPGPTPPKAPPAPAGPRKIPWKGIGVGTAATLGGGLLLNHLLTRKEQPWEALPADIPE